MAPAIVDTSVAIAWLLADEPLHSKAIAFRDQIVDGAIHPIVAWHHAFEVRHALVRAANRNRCAWGAIAPFLATMDAIKFELAPAAATDTLLLGLCRDLRLTWSDSQWVALAVRRGLPLVTTDMRLVRAVPSHIAWVEPLSGHPL